MDSEARREHHGTDPAGQEYDPSLDFLSASFDPAKALATLGLQTPDPLAQPVDNVAKCRSMLPPDHPDAICNVVKKVATEASKLKASQFKERAAKLTERVLGSCTMSLQKVHSFVKPGPIQALAAWFEESRRVRVVTRHTRGVRGVATGRLVAYDRYMNVVLKEVVEEYTVRLRVMRTVGGGSGSRGPGASDALPAPSLAGSSAAHAEPAQQASTSARGPQVPAGPGRGPGGPGLSREDASGPSAASALGDPVEPAGSNRGEVAAPVDDDDDNKNEPKVRWGFRQDHRRRNLAQIFIKGDNIVCISPEDQFTRMGPLPRPR